MSLHRVSDKVLLENTEKLASQEREILVDILHHLREIDRRKLFSALGFPSLFEYAKARLHYSDDQAYRRIDAMRLLRDVPEIEKKIDAGELSLAHINMAQKLFRKEKVNCQKQFSKEEKLNILSKLENKSAREAEKVVLELSSSPKNFIPDKIRPVADNTVEIKFAADEMLEEKIVRLKGLLAHKHPYLSLGDLFHQLCDLGLQKWDPLLRRVPQRSGDIALI